MSRNIAPDFTTADHVLIAGDSSDIPAIRELLASLSPEAYGAVFVEIAAPIQVVNLQAPRRVNVVWLHRDQHTSDIRGALGAIRGELLVRSVSAWVAEWMPEEPGDATFALWIGCSASHRVGELSGRIERMLG